MYGMVLRLSDEIDSLMFYDTFQTGKSAESIEKKKPSETNETETEFEEFTSECPT